MFHTFKRNSFTLMVAVGTLGVTTNASATERRTSKKAVVRIPAPLRVRGWAHQLQLVDQNGKVLKKDSPGTRFAGKRTSRTVTGDKDHYVSDDWDYILSTFEPGESMVSFLIDEAVRQLELESRNVVAGPKNRLSVRLQVSTAPVTTYVLRAEHRPHSHGDFGSYKDAQSPVFPDRTRLLATVIMDSHKYRALSGYVILGPGGEILATVPTEDTSVSEEKRVTQKAIEYSLATGQPTTVRKTFREGWGWGPPTLKVRDQLFTDTAQ